MPSHVTPPRRLRRDVAQCLRYRSNPPFRTRQRPQPRSRRG
jgi:hypothetical protein